MARRTKINTLECVCVGLLIAGAAAIIHDLGKGSKYIMRQPYIPLVVAAGLTGVASVLYRENNINNRQD